jgi:uridine kinase
MLKPLGPAGDRRCRPRLFDSFRDEAFPEEWIEVPDDAVAVVDGAFLLRPGLAGHWDYLVWLDIDFTTMVARGTEHDAAWGDAARAERRYREHWIPTHELYESLENPRGRADTVIDAKDWAIPRLLRLRNAT